MLFMLLDLYLLIIYLYLVDRILMDIPLIQSLNKYVGAGLNAGNTVMSQSIRTPDFTELTILVFKKRKNEIQEACAILAVSGTHSSSGYICFVP